MRPHSKSQNLQKKIFVSLNIEFFEEEEGAGKKLQSVNVKVSDDIISAVFYD